MPQIKIKTEHVKKLKELGVYDKWLDNIKYDMEIYGSNFQDFTTYSDFYDIIGASFIWSKTKEGSEFWGDTANK